MCQKFIFIEIHIYVYMYFVKGYSITFMNISETNFDSQFFSFEKKQH